MHGLATFRFVLVLALLASAPGMAQHVSLDLGQRQRLVRIVHDDPEAAKLFARVRKQADSALGDTPNPVRTIHLEGKLQGDADKTQSTGSMQDMAKVANLTYAFAVTGEQPYRLKALAFIVAWAHTNIPSGDPIDESGLERLFYAYDFLRADAPEQDRVQVDAWLRRMVAAERASCINRYNNWNSHRVKIIGLIAYLLQDSELIAYSCAQYKAQIDHNLQADGSSIDFHIRDALHYHVYDIDPLLKFALVARQNHTDLYGYKSDAGGSLQQAVAFLAPYATGAKSHAEFVHTSVPFDRKRAANNEAAFEAGHHFEPRHAAGVFELDAFFERDAAYKVLRAMGQTFNNYPSWQTVLNAAVGGL